MALDDTLLELNEKNGVNNAILFGERWGFGGFGWKGGFLLSQEFILG